MQRVPIRLLMGFIMIRLRQNCFISFSMPSPPSSVYSHLSPFSFRFPSIDLYISWVCVCCFGLVLFLSSHNFFFLIIFKLKRQKHKFYH